jgi:DNA modification methylase
MKELQEIIDTVTLGDCQEVLKEFPDGKVNLIVTSPPYAYNRKKTYGGVPIKKYVDWFLPISDQLKRVLDPKGSFVLNIKERCVNGERGTYVYELVIALRRQGWRWVDDYIWHKKNTYPGKWKYRFRDVSEHCYHFTKSEEFNMYQDAVKVPVGKWADKRLSKLSDTDKKRDESKTLSGFGKNISNWVGRDLVYPDNVLYLATECSNRNHSAAFPLDLPKWFIRLFTKKDDIVLDPFMGSGTTALAALELERHYIGIELMKQYYDRSLERIKEFNLKNNHQIELFDIKEEEGIGNSRP